MTRTPRVAALVVALALAGGACARKTPPVPAGVTHVASVTGLKTPESAWYDADLDIWFVSNINGNPSEEDDNGFISRVGPDGALLDTAFIQGGARLVVLNAPKGMVVIGDTLWVTDIDQLRAFDKRNGAPLVSVSFTSFDAQFLNDVAVGPDGALYVTDTGVRIGSQREPGVDRVFRLAPDRRTVTVALEGAALTHPNGILWDETGGRFIIAPYGGTAVLAWRPGDSSPAALATGPGRFDGVVRLPDGRLVFASWADASLHVLDTTGALTRWIPNLPSPADLGLDPARKHVAVPLFNEDRVEIWMYQ